MAEIILNVDEKAAEKWLPISEEERSKVSALISSVLASAEEPVHPKSGFGLPKPSLIRANVKKIKKSESAYLENLKNERIEAAINGLTPEILHELLCEDE